MKKLKNGLEILSFYTSVPKIVIICFNVPEIWHMDVIVIFHFGLFFCPFTPVIAQKNQNFNKKKYLEISSFYTCVPKIMIRWCTVPEKWCMTDEQKKWHTEVGVPPKNTSFYFISEVLDIVQLLKGQKWFLILAELLWWYILDMLILFWACPKCIIFRHSQNHCILNILSSILYIEDCILAALVYISFYHYVKKD